MAFYSANELHQIGLKKIGKNVLLSKNASLYNVSNISIDDNSRIDDFCILSAGEGGIYIGKNVHVACYSSLIGKGKIELHDFANISSRVAIYSSNDDYSGNSMTNPTIPEKFKNVQHGDVSIGKHVIIGVGSSILPSVSIGKGSAVAAYSFVNNIIPESSIYAGIPAKYIKDRSTNLFNLEKLFNEENLNK
jgi:galactoside O-acetyltransferase